MLLFVFAAWLLSLGVSLLLPAVVGIVVPVGARGLARVRVPANGFVIVRGIGNAIVNGVGLVIVLVLGLVCASVAVCMCVRVRGNW